MSPTTRYLARGAFVGILAAAASLQAILPGVTGDDIIQAVIAGIVGFGAYSGVGAATPLEPKIGKKS